MDEQFPPLVARACVQARQLGFPLTREEAGPERHSACLPGVGQFLAVLAAGCQGGRISELGTGAGIGAAWMASAMPPDCTLTTVEIDESLASAAREMFSGDARVDVVTGDAVSTILSRGGPVSLIFADSGVRDDATFDGLVRLLAPGGWIVMDDLTPQQAMTPTSPFLANDTKRRFFSQHPQLMSTEVVLPDLRNSLLAATRVS